jgi:hypothetical protein
MGEHTQARIVQHGQHVSGPVPAAVVHDNELDLARVADIQCLLDRVRH